MEAKKCSYISLFSEKMRIIVLKKGEYKSGKECDMTSLHYSHLSFVIFAFVLRIMIETVVVVMFWYIVGLFWIPALSFR